ncbi:TonB-dependent receptor [Pseudoalteromonas aurantia]|uniref:Ferrienterochelin and colicins outer membrane receptor n=1 Tax=Pseudoalteromonas aurantia 208 TaxID=1314867 RepID=A0ABR9EE55_9GAMM|nr:TonB-dependent receptor [Pseudoalteromonas aurantia]MBE0369112.1 ferrienterochelin and colicins outer membrane receptor [Pseudoalteromonas aurantia 208]
MLNNKVSKAVRLAFAFGAASTVAFSANTFAAEEDKVERIEVTGSSIKGTDLAGALPIDVISAEDIKNTGVTSVPDLVAQIPSMQGFTTPVSSVGGGGAGIATASLRGLGDQYTLVLLNGRRLAPSGSGSSVNLNNIPLAAVERVEVLTDGASALYGSDAIAGVINFILKSEQDGTTVAFRTDQPKDGAESYNLSVTTGYGDFDRDGFSIVASLSHDTTDSLRSADREFAKTGFLEFEHNGNQYYDINGSSNSIPGNAFLTFEDGTTTAFTPFARANNGCDVNTAFAPGDTFCSFDFTSQLEIFPENERTALMLQTDIAVTDDIKAFGTFNYTDFSLTSRVAPMPTGNIRIALDSVLFERHIVPNLTAEQAANVTEFRGRWRGLPGGNRTDENNTKSFNAIVGFEGVMFDDIDFNTAVVYSKSERSDTRLNGYYNEKFADFVGAGRIDIFKSYEDFMQDSDSLAALEEAQYREKDDDTTTESLSFDFRASQAVFELPAGDVYAGYGVDYRTNTYKSIRSAANVSDRRFGDGGGDFDYELERSTYGAFVEFQIPATDDLSFNVAARYDSIGAVSDKLSGAGDVNTEENDTTYKVSFRYQATDDLVVRGSVGTGFRAATLIQIAEPLSSFGVTSNNYTCPLPSSDSRAAFCPPGSLQYQRFNLGSSSLSPETSDQSSIGFVYSPSTDFSFEVDYWSVEITDQVQRPDQDYMFANPGLFDERFIVAADRSDATNQLLSVVTAPINIGKNKTSGYDWKFVVNNDLSFGELKTMVQGTYIDQSEYTLAGVFPYEWTSSLGRYGTDQDVVFRNIINVTNSLTHGDFGHTLRFKYKSGWKDAPANVGTGTIANPGIETFYDSTGTEQTRFATTSVQFRIPSHMTVDYKVEYKGVENMNIAVGVNNLLDKAPPMSLADPEGHLVGYEGRYYDQFLRTYYVSVDYTF